ncbi:hypothetical protein Q3390_14100 [Clostridioides difficile]
MHILTEEQIEEIYDKVDLLPLSEVENILDYEFDCGIEEYNSFLSEAKMYDDYNISKVHLLLDRETNNLIGYMALCSDAIKLSSSEKRNNELIKIPFASMPALKIGKLAISNKEEYKNKGYGSFLLEIARLLAFEINKNGLACRFLTVDTDIEYNENTPMFYNKNGFIKNNSGVYSNRTQCISMRADILNRHQVQVEEKEYIL